METFSNAQTAQTRTEPLLGQALEMRPGKTGMRHASDGEESPKAGADRPRESGPWRRLAQGVRTGRRG